MKFKKLLFTTLLLMMIAVVGCSNDTTTESNEEPNEQQNQEQTAQTIDLPQFTESHVDAATMVLISAPPLQPTDHEGRWDQKIGQDSCLTCHQDSKTSEIPLDHFVDQNRSNGIFGPMNQCITCHATDSGDPKSAFNRD